MPPALRFEFYLPSFYNDGMPIEPTKYRQVKNKILEIFKGYSVHPATVQGMWIDPKTNKIYGDCSYRFEVSAEKNESNLKFFENYKEELKKYLNNTRFI